MVNRKVTMHIAEYLLILCSLFFISYGLNCRTEGGPKETELKKIYNICMKQQSKSNNNNTSGDLDQDWRETRRYNQRSQDNMARTRGNANNNYGMNENDHGEGNTMHNKDRAEERHKMSRQDRTSKSRDDRMQHSDRNEDEMMYSRDGRDKNENINNYNRLQRNNGVNDRNDFYRNENFGELNNNYYSTQSPRRYKRERRVEVNSGKRSQYNPNPQRFSGYEGRGGDEGKNSSENNSTNDDDSRACAVHCLLENLQMIGENGIPDRYLVTHTITKDVKNEDLKDFLEESIEECFQILDNENTDEKCEFSKNLMMCLSEKGRANCDDWKENFQF